MQLPGVELVALSRDERRWFFTLFGLLVVAAWLLLLLPGVSEYTDHSRVFTRLELDAVLPKLLPFLAVWTLMMWAMMLPSTLSVQGAVVKIAESKGIGMAAPILFSAGYLGVWSSFGIVVFWGDYVVHSVVENSRYLHDHELIVTGSVVLLAGVYQFTPLKDACLKSCRSPLAFVIARRREGLRGLVLMGADHGLFCLGCCWALMLLMFAFAVSSWLLMTGMAVYFFAEKAVKNSEPLGQWTGTIAISAGIVLLIRGLWLS